MAAGSTYTPIATNTLSSTATSYTFSSIPSTYTDLILILNQKNTATTANVQLQYNSDTGTNYSWTNLYGLGTSYGSGRDSNSAYSIIGTSFTGFGNHTIQLQNYSNTTTYKTILSRSGQGDNNVTVWANLWRSTSAINSIKIYLAGGNSFDVGSTFTLYGIAAA